jgi:3-deoxy-D-manno-octulosonate 8-phosphate phosphatase (KDO 8-P phosphatase)
MSELKDKLKLIKLIVLDVDGVLTDGSIIYAGADIDAKAFHVQDGFGITMAKHAGLKFGVLTGRVADAVKRRVTELGFDFYESGHFYKYDALKAMIESAGLTKENVLYMGDDILDLVCQPLVGVFAAPLNAVKRVKSEADWVIDIKGGNAAVRAMIDELLLAQGTLKSSEDYFMNSGDK